MWACISGQIGAISLLCSLNGVFINGSGIIYYSCGKYHSYGCLTIYWLYEFYSETESAMTSPAAIMK